MGLITDVPLDGGAAQISRGGTAEMCPKPPYTSICRFSPTRAGFSHKVGHTGAVTLIQRFGSALNLNIHF